MLVEATKRTKNKGFVVVSQADLLQLDTFLRTQIIPKQLFYFRNFIQSSMAILNEETLEFEITPLEDLELDADHPVLHYLLEIPTSAFPEFVHEYMACPFKEFIPRELSPFRFLEKSAYNSILRASSELIAKIAGSIKELSGRNTKHNVLNFFPEFYLTNTPLLHHPNEGGFLQIDLAFDVSYKD